LVRHEQTYGERAAMEFTGLGGDGHRIGLVRYLRLTPSHSANSRTILKGAKDETRSNHYKRR
jgi:hypothetical protein